MIRVFVFALALSVLGTASAQEEVRREGRVWVEGDSVLLLGEGGSTRLEGPMAEGLRVLAGEQATVGGFVGEGGLDVTQVLSPRRVELSVRPLASARDGGVVVETEGGRLRATGRADLLVAGVRQQVDAWRFDAERIVIVAVEAQTTRTWTILRSSARPPSLPIGWIRGVGRRVWLLERRDDKVRVRRGDREGWVNARAIAVGELDDGSAPLGSATSRAAAGASRRLADAVPDADGD